MTELIKKVLRLDCGIGTDSAEFYLVDAVSAADEKYMEEYAWERAVEHAGSYGVYPESDKPEDYDEEEHDSWRDDSYSDDINGYWEDYNPDEHDGLVIGGCEIEWLEM